MKHSLQIKTCVDAFKLRFEGKIHSMTKQGLKLMVCEPVQKWTTSKSVSVQNGREASPPLKSRSESMNSISGTTFKLPMIPLGKRKKLLVNPPSKTRKLQLFR